MGITHRSKSDVVTVHESTFNHSLLHSNSIDPSAEEKAALAGTYGAPGAANKYVTDSDPRNSDPRIPTSHTHTQSEITGLVSDLESKANLYDGKVPASELGGPGADSTKFLRGDRTWAIPPFGNNFVQITVDFGFASGNEDFNAIVTVPAPWIRADSRIICLPSGIATVHHDPEDYAVEGIMAYPANIIPGVGLDIIASAKNGTFGTLGSSGLSISTPSEAFWIPREDNYEVVIREGEGVVFWQPDAGSNSDTRKVVSEIMWEEYNGSRREKV